MRVKSLITVVVLSLSTAGLAVLPARAASPSQLFTATTRHVSTPRPLAPHARSVPARSVPAQLVPARSVPDQSSIPSGDSLVSVPGGGPANLRYDACISDDWAPQNPYAPYDPCGINAAIGNGSNVVMRCWTDNQPPTSENSAWTSPRWFFVTLDSGNPENNVSGFIYSALVAGQVSTPNCGGTYYDEYYPFQPSQSSIGIYDETGGVFTIDMDNIALGSAGVYCHLGTSGYPTGGTVSYLGQYKVDGNESIKVPFCGTGTQWVGINASDGITRYTGEVTIGSNQPPPTPGYLGGIGGQPLTFQATDGYAVGSSITVTGYPAENFGQTNVSVANLALAATSPDGGTDEAVCYSGLTVAPGQIVYCPGTFTPDVAGTWQLNLDWQGSDGTWHHLYEPLDLQIAAVPPPPANDNFANAEDITGLSSFSGTNAGATAQPAEPDHYLGLPARNSVWFRFTASKSGRARVSIDTSSDVTALAAYAGGAVDDLTRLATWDAMGHETIAFKVAKGHVYHVAVDDDYGYYPGTAFSGSVAINPIIAPANDNFAHAQPITAGKVYTTDFANATTEPGEPAAWPGEADHGSVWYSYRPSADVAMTLSSPGSTDDVDVALFTGKSVKSLNRLGYNWLGRGHSWTITLSAGQAYHIAIDNYNDAQDKTSGIPPTLRFELKATVRPRPRDTTPPSGRITRLVPGPGKLTAYWAASDSQSGYDHAQIRVQRIVAHGSQHPWVATGALRGTSASVRITTTARYRVEIRFADKSGNVSAWTTQKTVAIRGVSSAQTLRQRASHSP